ncbi:Uncharacterized protein LI90_2207 [Carbonactinospora thermoautotrophica]|uniref:DUF305 domain-containing protein n=2 Tax=Carbonactinospora thermoautotrophica TaxID=1469144 RepID=A0A132MTM1_9ACTN|nr:DUF305 domain-containing protein [Carbonactinospora thermoautotrophica]KWX01179.1 Uncharacterized protein LI90_2207 [Carbonactinospora thermoautotrophica]
MRTRMRAVVLASATLTGALLLAGCGGQDQQAGPAAKAPTPPATATTPAQQFNDADVTFAQQMIPHHQQAVDMAELAETHAQDAEVKKLAAKIQAAQAPEIEMMSGWLRAWGKPVPTAMPSVGHGGHQMPSMGGHQMPGMMTQQEMDQLMAARGAEFDRMFLQMMIKHHEGAVEMARTEQAQGVNPEAKKLAGQIAASQTAEIAEMRELLGQA